MPIDRPVPSPSSVPPVTLSRRRFLVLTAATGILAGCGSTVTSVKQPTATPPTRIPVPSESITAANVRHIAQLGTLHPQSGAVRAVAWSPDGGLLAAGGAQDITLWDTTTGALAATWKGHTNRIYDLAWSKARNQVASASDDGTVRVWDPAKGTTVQVLKSAANVSIYSTAWSPDGSRLLGGTHDGRTLLWDASSWHLLATWVGPVKQGTTRPSPNLYAVWGVAWSPDGRRVVSPRYDTLVFVWEVGTQKALAVLHPPDQPNTVAWSPDGRSFASVHDDSSVVLWDATTYGKQRRLSAADTFGWSYRVTYSPDSTMVATSGEDGSIRWWDSQTGAALAQARAFTSAMWALAWSPDGKRMAAASDDGTIQFWGIA